MMDQESKHSPETRMAAMNYIMMMLLQRLDSAGHISLTEMIAGVEGDQAAATDVSSPVQATFGAALELLHLADGYRSNRRSPS
ncbi:hypothetical protein [Herbaspirillum huttiense]|uniref:hypothetical protein n=1 Tax=Herbaspirillum huttiense TaxID=863372 RepID=UPI0039B0379A